MTFAENTVGQQGDGASCPLLALEPCFEIHCFI